jgi:hypothetical protein
MNTKWLNRDRKRSKKTTARRIDSQYRERGQGKDSDQKKRDAQFRKNLSNLAEELTDMLNN